MGAAQSSPTSPPVPEPLLPPGAFFEPLVLQWACGLLLLQVVLQLLFSFSSSERLSKAAALVAHQYVVSVPFAYATIRGVQLFLFDEAVAALAAGTYLDRLYGFLPATWDLTRFFLGFQMYDLLATVLVPDLRKFEHCLHHVLSLLTALAGTSGPYMQFYAPFFFGFVEVSSVPLAWVDLFRMLPPAKGTLLSAVNEVVRIAFAVSFLPIRCVIFPGMLIYYLFPDMWAAYTADDVRAPISLGWFMVSGTALASLQLYWGTKIVRILAKQFLGSAVDRNKEA